MLDRLGREINYARISVSGRCNLRCVYCMPAGHTFGRGGKNERLLSFDEITRIAAVFGALGIRRLRITGGEPLTRPFVSSLVASLKRLSGIEQVFMTTNGQMLSAVAKELAEAGLDGVNVSLDTLDSGAYKKLTGGELWKVLDGINAALAEGLPVKINSVLVNAAMLEEAPRLAALAKEKPVEPRFIELMPLGEGQRFGGLESDLVLKKLESVYGTWNPVPAAGGGPAKMGVFQGFVSRVGFISPLSSPFCARCNRIRLTSEGVLYGCLHSGEGAGLVPLLEKDDGELRRAVESVIWNKARSHHFSREPRNGGKVPGPVENFREETPMYHIGG